MIIKSADWFCKTEVYYLSLMEDLINNKEALALVGLGYVGLPMNLSIDEMKKLYKESADDAKIDY